MSFSTLHKLGGYHIKIEIIQSEQYEKVLDFLRLNFYKEEPLTIGIEPKQQTTTEEDYTMDNIKHGTCLLAMLQGSDKIVGVVIAGPKGPNQDEFLFKWAIMENDNQWGHNLHFLAGVERNANVCKEYDVERVLHVYALAVDTTIRGRNIGCQLLSELMVLGRQLQFELLTADCTSYYSARICERLGWDCVNIAYYRDYVDENNKQIIKPPLPHNACRTFAIRL